LNLCALLTFYYLHTRDHSNNRASFYALSSKLSLTFANLDVRLISKLQPFYTKLSDFEKQFNSFYYRSALNEFRIVDFHENFRIRINLRIYHSKIRLNHIQMPLRMISLKTAGAANSGF
jgi:hypothetical protein